MQVVRFGVSLEENLMEDLDKLVKTHKFPNRSQAIRHLIKNHTVDQTWKKNQVVAGVITLVYDHHKRDLQKQSTTVQHDFHHLILCAQHVHLDHHNCMESIAVKGKANELIALSDKLKAIKGMKHGQLTMTTTGHSHSH